MRDVTAVRAAPGSGAALRIMAIGTIIVAAACTAVFAHAQGRDGPGAEGHGGPGMMMFGGAPEHMGRSLDRMLDGLNASEAQRSQIRQIAMAAATDLRAQRESGRALHDQAMQIFTAPSVDAAAAESLRQQMLARHDQASKRMLQAMLDVAKVLTPEQRARIGERMKDRQAMMKDRMERMHRDHDQGGPHTQPPK